MLSTPLTGSECTRTESVCTTTRTRREDFTQRARGGGKTVHCLRAANVPELKAFALQQGPDERILHNGLEEERGKIAHCLRAANLPELEAYALQQGPDETGSRRSGVRQVVHTTSWLTNNLASPGYPLERLRNTAKKEKKKKE